MHAGGRDASRITVAVDYDVIPGISGEQFYVNDLCGVVQVVIDLDPKLRFEIRDRIGPDVVRPVVNIEDVLVLGVYSVIAAPGAKEDTEANEQRFSTNANFSVDSDRGTYD